MVAPVEPEPHRTEERMPLARWMVENMPRARTSRLWAMHLEMDRLSLMREAVGCSAQQGDIAGLLEVAVTG